MMVYKVIVTSFLFLGSSFSWAKGVYLNGVNISHVKNQTIEGATVRISPSGDVFIDAPQYQVKELDEGLSKKHVPLGKMEDAGETTKMETGRKARPLPEQPDDLEKPGAKVPQEWEQGKESN